ncbi:hypothetical protein ACEW7V_02120 [Areca yellow leaf disease phytoplasma]|uniref:hypothetical protein n=1 Tax=Areca yellow leaf disease phytoplasma TaxID=927614 RepID=UPI0035B56D57
MNIKSQELFLLTKMDKVGADFSIQCNFINNRSFLMPFNSSVKNDFNSIIDLLEMNAFLNNLSL